VYAKLDDTSVGSRSYHKEGIRHQLLNSGITTSSMLRYFHNEIIHFLFGNCICCSYDTICDMEGVDRVLVVDVTCSSHFVLDGLDEIAQAINFRLLKYNPYHQIIYESLSATNV
jgi:hypothetical protein